MSDIAKTASTRPVNKASAAPVFLSVSTKNSNFEIPKKKDMDGSNIVDVELTVRGTPTTSPRGTKGGPDAIYEHHLPINELIELLRAEIDIIRPGMSKGLGPQESETRLSKYGANLISPPKRHPWYLRFIELLTNLFNLLLLIGGIGYLLLFGLDPVGNFRNIYIGIILIVVAFINAGIELYELSKIYSIMSGLKEIVPMTALVVRSGIGQKVPAKTLVPGDVIHIKSGDKIPADAVVFHSTDLKVDCSNINGESELSLIRPQLDGCPKTVELFDASNLIFSGCIASTGEGYGIVVRTGDKTVIGQLSSLSKSDAKRHKSPLSREINSFSRIISILAIVTGGFFFIVSLIITTHFTYALTFCISILVSWIPQGLPVSVTLILTIACTKMAKQNVLVKDLHGVETLGAITLLATDKTGTLTTNKMTVMTLWTDAKYYFCGPVQDCPEGMKAFKLDAPGISQIVQIAVTNTHAKFDRNDVPVSERKILGDATETALLKFASTKLANVDKLSELYPKVFEIPFSSENKYQISIHRKAHSTGGLTMHIKGAAEIIYSLCSHMWMGGKAELKNEARSKLYHDAHTKLSADGLRVIAFAFLPLRGDKYPDNWRFDAEKRNYATDNFIFLGLTGLQDPPKSGVRECIGNIRQAGIKVMMITGDHPSTAQIISRKVNILTKDTPLVVQSKEQLPLYPPDEYSKSAIIVSGSTLSHFSDLDWFAALSYSEIIFARTSPVQKLEIVKRSQAMGHIVAVTGDGVNDSAALKKADLGISMNLTGSDSSKENAGMILLDDNFSTTATGIFEGRLVFMNLKKAIKFGLSHLMAELIPFLCYVLIPIPLALTPVQTLAVDLGFNLFLTLSFAWECAEDRKMVMNQPPRIPLSASIARGKYSIAYELEDSADRLKSPTADEDHHDGGRDYFDESAGMLNEKDLGTKLKEKHLNNLQHIKSATKKSYWIKIYKDWQMLFTLSGERIIDLDILIYAYIEAGLIIFTGCFISYAAVFYFGFGITMSDAYNAQTQVTHLWSPYSPPLQLANGKTLSGNEQYEALAQAQSAYFLAILILQAFNLFAVKASSRFPIGAFMLNNTKTWIGLFSGFSLAFIIVYTPFSNNIFLTSMNLNQIFLLIPASFGLVLFLYAALRRIIWHTVYYGKVLINKEISGIDMNESLEALP